MNKKAISPLIATVLLIGFTIALAAMVWYWYGGIVKEQAQKQSAVGEIKTACAASIDFSINKVIPVTTSQEVNITLKNNKDNVINGLFIRITGNVGTQAKKEIQSLSSLEQKEVAVKYDPNKVGTKLSYVEVMPIIVRQGVAGTCSEKLIKYEIK